MISPPRYIARVALALCLLLPGLASAQGTTEQSPAVTVSATGGRVRFAAPSGVVRLQVEVFGEAGQAVFDATTRGSVFDWPLADGAGQRVGDGSYLCVVTVKALGGRISQRVGAVVVQSGRVETRAATPEQITAVQRTVGPVEGNAALTVLDQADAPAATVLAHDGRDGQIVTTAGDLVFRGGDFFTGRDRELMRLSADGSLTVEGSLTARGGIRFSDGTTLESARGVGGSPVLPAADAPVSPSAIQNRLAKFGTSGSLVDSGITENSDGDIGVGSAPARAVRLGVSSPFGKIPFAFTQDASETAFPTLAYFSTSDGPIGQYAAARYNDVGTFLMGATKGKNFALFADNSYKEPHLLIDAAGNVGVGTLAPQSRLEVAGDVRVSGEESGIVFADGTKQASAGLTTVARDETLVGNGTAASPLGVALSPVTAERIANGSVTDDHVSPTANISPSKIAAGITPAQISTNGAEAGQVLTFDGAGLSYATPPARVSGSGVEGAVPVWSGAGSLGSSVITQSEGAVGVAGNVAQTRDRGGFVKAMIYVNADGGVARCFNSFLAGGAASSAPCGFTVTKIDAGAYRVDFGFQVSDRFFSLTLGNPVFLTGTVTAADLAPALGANRLLVLAFDTNDGGYVNTPFSLVVY